MNTMEVSNRIDFSNIEFKSNDKEPDNAYSIAADIQANHNKLNELLALANDSYVKEEIPQNKGSIKDLIKREKERYNMRIKNSEDTLQSIKSKLKELTEEADKTQEGSYSQIFENAFENEEGAKKMSVKSTGRGKKIKKSKETASSKLFFN